MEPNLIQIALLEARRKANFPAELTGLEKLFYDRLGEARQFFYDGLGRRIKTHAPR